jgi:hypothetical protein
MITGIFKIINLRVFLLSLFLGLIFIYLNDNRKKINVYPTPSNINKVEYKDRAQNCYEYSMEKIKCPNKSSQINHVPVQ